MSSPRMSTDEIWQYVEQAPTGIVVTLRRDGWPVALPVWFACLDQQIYFRTRGKKLERIANDSRAAFLVESGVRWAELKAVHFTGSAEVVKLDEPMFERFLQELDRKYALARAITGEMPTKTAEYYANAHREVVRFTHADRILHWDNSKLAHGRD